MGVCAVVMPNEIATRLSRGVRRSWKVLLMLAVLWGINLSLVTFVPKYVGITDGTGILLAYLYFPCWVPGIVWLCWANGKREG